MSIVVNDMSAELAKPRSKRDVEKLLLVARLRLELLGVPSPTDPPELVEQRHQVRTRERQLLAELAALTPNDRLPYKEHDD